MFVKRVTDMRRPAYVILVSTDGLAPNLTPGQLLTVFIDSNLLPLVAPLVVATTTCGAATDIKLAWWQLSVFSVVLSTLIHWDRVAYIFVSELTIIGSDNGLSPGRRQAIIWTNAGILLIGPLGTNFSEILIEIHIFSFRKMHLKMSSAW